jgi:hypothetical protein
MWRKLAVNCTINALTAVHGCPNGALLEPGAAGDEFAALCAETATVLEALGQHAIAAELPATAAEVARRTATNRSSMLQDALARRRTEIDYINGFWRARPASPSCALCARCAKSTTGAGYPHVGTGLNPWLRSVGRTPWAASVGRIRGPHPCPCCSKAACPKALSE